MINYQKSKNILKKSKIKILDEIIESSKSLNRVISENIFSKVDYPAGDNAAFDGYAINSNDTKYIDKKNPKFFKIIGSIYAGTKPLRKKLKKFDAIEIMTGGLINKPFNTIIPVEQAILLRDQKNRKSILIDKEIKISSHVRFRASDFKKGELLVKKGTIIQPNHIIAFKTLGIKKIKVKMKINILFFSTGNEISNNVSIPNWKVRNSNSHYIENLNKNFLFNFTNGGILKDSHKNIFKSKIKKVLKSKVNIILTSGAVSAGKFDFIPEIVKSFRVSKFFKSVMIRPGKPILFAQIKQKAIFGLPGNPISTAACFRFFVYPYIENILGIAPEKPIKAILKNDFNKKKNFTRFIKSRINTTKNGKIQVKLLPGQESFRIKSFANSNAWAILPHGKSNFKKGQIVDCFFVNRPNKFLT